MPAARAAFTEAQNLGFRLPERDRMRLKGLNYRISGEQDKLEKFLSLQVRITGDAAAYRDLANFLMLTGRLREAKRHFRSAMELDTADFSTHLQLAQLERATGRLPASLEEVQCFLEHRSKDYSAILLKADLLSEAGEFEQAIGAQRSQIAGKPD